MELAKQGWTGVASKRTSAIAAAATTSQSSEAPLNNRRKPIGDLPGFISLSQYSSDEEVEATETSGDEKEIDEAYDLIWQARCDYRVWKSGLDRAYVLYLGSKPSVMTLTAVLLSIL